MHRCWGKDVYSFFGSLVGSLPVRAFEIVSPEKYRIPETPSALFRNFRPKDRLKDSEYTHSRMFVCIHWIMASYLQCDRSIRRTSSYSQLYSLTCMWVARASTSETGHYN